MPKSHTKRVYYRNGGIRAEIKEVEGQFHGPYRIWHYNGQLAEELRYQQGRLHGTSRQWDENGRLLGSFTMNDGSGTQRYWHQNGVLRIEADSCDGKFHGRTRIWLRDGMLIGENYYVNGTDATRAAYLKAARKHPGWPQYARQSAGRVARENSALKRRQHELLVESILEKSHAEARQWLKAAKKPNLRSLAKFRTAGTALRFVETLYAAGASAVIVAPIYAGKRDKLFADWLVIKLPGTPAKRKTLRKLCRDFCGQRAVEMLPGKDSGESHLIMKLA